MNTSIRTMELQRFYDKQRIDHPTALVHIERSMSRVAEALIPLIIFVVQRTTKDRNGYYIITKSFIRSATKQKNQDYSSARQGLDELYDKSIHINVFREDNTVDEFEERLLVGKMANPKRGTLGFKVNPDIEERIKNPRVFARYRLVFMLLLASKKGAFAFYQLMTDFLSRSKGKEECADFSVAIPSFKAYMGMREESYQIFRELKKKVLKPLCEYVNEKTDVFVVFKGERRDRGRQFSHIRFIVKRQGWQLPLLELPELEQLAKEMNANVGGEKPLLLGGWSERGGHLIERISGHGVNREDAVRALEKWGEAGVTEILEAFEKRKKSKKSERIDDPAGYLARCLEKGYGMKTPEQRAGEYKQKAKKKQKEEREQAREELERLRKEFGVCRVDEALQRLSDKENAALQARFRESIKGNPLYRKWKSEEITHPVLQNLFRVYVNNEVLSSPDEEEFADFVKKRGHDPVRLQKIAECESG